MVGHEGEGQPQRINESALHAHKVFSLLLRRGDALRQGRTTISQPDVRGQQLLASLRPLIDRSEASPAYKAKLQREMFGPDGRYRGLPYDGAAFWYFGVEPSLGFEGIFNRDQAPTIEAQRMLFDAGTTIGQATLDTEVFPEALRAATQDRDNIRYWADSYRSHFRIGVIDVLEESLQFSSDDRSRQQRIQEIARLRRLLEAHHQGE